MILVLSNNLYVPSFNKLLHLTGLSAYTFEKSNIENTIKKNINS